MLCLHLKLTLTIIIEACMISQVFSWEFSNSSSHCALRGGLAENQDCPNWFKPPTAKNGTCDCGCDISSKRMNIMVRCHSDKHSTEISVGSCLTYDEDKGVSLANACPFNFLSPNNSSRSLIALPDNLSQLNSRMCGPLRREGPLCSRCKDGLGPAVMSYKMICVKCFDSRYGWVIYVAAVLVPTTVFFLIIVCFKVNITSASMNMFILLCQNIVNVAIQIPFLATKLNVLHLNKFLLSFYGFWNLDFFQGVLPPFCFSSKMNILQVLALNYIVAIYPLLFTAVVYYCIEFHDKGNRFLMWAWKPFRKVFWCFRKTWDLKGSVINAFATFALLSYSKIIFTSLNLLNLTDIYNGCGEVIETVLYFDPSVAFFSRAHLPYAVVAIIIAAVFYVFPLIILLFYQNRHFHRLLACCRLKNTLLTEVTKVFQKSFKNGNNGDPDYRWFAGVYIMYRGVYMIPIYFFTIILSGGAVLLVALLQPYKQKKFNILDSVMYSIIALTIMYGGFALKDDTYPLYPIKVAFTLPLVYFILLVTYKLLKLTKKFTYCKTIVKKTKRVLLRQTSNEDQHIFSHRFYHPEEYKPLSPVIADQDHGDRSLTHGRDLREENEEHGEVEQPLPRTNDETHNHELYGTV